MKWNEQIRQERQSRGWTQSMLAEKLGTAKQTIIRWENGHTFPHRYYRDKLMGLLGISFEEWNPPNTDEDEVLEQACPSADPDAQQFDLLLDADEDDEPSEKALSSLTQLPASQASAQERTTDSLLEYDGLLTQGKRRTRPLGGDGQSYKRDILLPGGRLFWFRVGWDSGLGHRGRMAMSDPSHRFSGRSLLIGSLILLCVLCVVTITVQAVSTRTMTRTMTTTIIDDSIQGTGPNQFTYVGSGWGHCPSGPGYVCGGGDPSTLYNASNSWDGITNDYVTLSFVGTQIKFYGVLDSMHGIGAVSIDGGSETMIDFYAARRLGNHLLWASPILPEGTHLFKLRVTGTKNPHSFGTAIVPDRVDVMSS